MGQAHQLGNHVPRRLVWRPALNDRQRVSHPMSTGREIRAGEAIVNRVFERPMECQMDVVDGLD